MVYPIRVKRRGVQAVTSWSDHAVRWLFDPQNPFGLPRFFSDVSAGFVRLYVDVHDVVRVEDTLFVDTVTRASRSVAIEACLVLAREHLGLTITDHDGVAFVVLDGAVDAGAQSLFVGSIRNAAILDEQRTWSFIAHEVAHAMGYQHSFRASSATATYPDGEYGSAHCLMSAESWGGHAPVIPLTPDPLSGIPPTSPLWRFGGPAPSPVATWATAPGFIRPDEPRFVAPDHPHPFVKVLPADTTLETVTLVRPSLPGVSVLAIPDHTGTDYLTVEYRPTSGWDQNVGAGGSQPARPGVLIQRVRDIPAMPQYGDGYKNPKLRRAAEEHLISEDSAAREWSDGHIGVRVLSSDGDSAEVLIGRQLQPGAVQVVSETTDRTEISRTPSGEIAVYFGGASCDRRTIELERVLSRTTVSITADAFALTEPQISFFVGPHQILEAGPHQLILDVEVRIPVGGGLTPTGYNFRTWVALTCAANDGSLTITSPGAPGSFTIPVTIASKDAQGNPVSLQRQYVIVDTTLELPSGAVAEQRACTVVLRELGEDEVGPLILLPGDDLVVGGPDWEKLSLGERLRQFHRLNPVRRPISLQDMRDTPVPSRKAISWIKRRPSV